jgi:Mg/Co/Ni transporter MgtE
VDADGRMLGIITADDVLEFAERRGHPRDAESSAAPKRSKLRTSTCRAGR